MDRIRLASTDDPVARAQASRVRALLESRPEPLAVVWLAFESSIDPSEQMSNLAQKLVDGEIDVAAYPAERLPAGLPDGIRIEALLRDRAAHYCCLSSGQPVLSALADGARVVTCDTVARAQLLYRFARLRIELAGLCAGVLYGLRGGQWDAAVVPASLLEAGSLAGLRYEAVSVEDVTPAVGLGVVAVLARDEPPARHEIVGPLDEPDTRMQFDAERTFLGATRAVKGSICTAQACRHADVVEVTGVIVDRDGGWLVRDQAWAPPRFANLIAREVSESCETMARAQRITPPPRHRVPSF